MSMSGQSEEDATVGILRNACDPQAKSGEFYGPLGKGRAPFFAIHRREAQLGIQTLYAFCVPPR